MKNRDYLESLRQYESHDATFLNSNESIVFARAKGSQIWDVENRSYIDLCAGFGALPLGHNHSSFLGLLHQQSDEICHGMGDVYSSVDKCLLLKEFIEILPAHLTRGNLALSGAGAVEYALKTAMLATGKSEFISFVGAYHGLDLGVLPVTHRRDFSEKFPIAPATFLPFACDRATLTASLKSEKFAAVIVEPIQGRNGVIPANREWLQMLREETQKAKVLLIFDEVMTGLGRSGQITFARDVPADLVCFGKAFGGGMPLSICVGTETTMGAWPESKGEALHTGTFFGHPLSCRIARDTLKTIAKENLVERSNILGEKVLNFLGRALSKESVRSVRGRGLFSAIEFHADGMGAKLMTSCLSKGVIVLAGGSRGQCVSFTPALNIEESMLMEGLETVLASI